MRHTFMVGTRYGNLKPGEIRDVYDMGKDTVSRYLMFCVGSMTHSGVYSL